LDCPQKEPENPHQNMERSYDFATQAVSARRTTKVAVFIFVYLKYIII